MFYNIGSGGRVCAFTVNDRDSAEAEPVQKKHVTML